MYIVHRLHDIIHIDYSFHTSSLKCRSHDDTMLPIKYNSKFTDENKTQVSFLTD